MDGSNFWKKQQKQSAIEKESFHNNTSGYKTLEKSDTLTEMPILHGFKGSTRTALEKMALHLTLLMKLLIGAVMIGITTVIHATVCDFVFRFVENYENSGRGSRGHIRKILPLVFSVFCIGFAIMIYIWLWTLLFYHLEGTVLKDFETALYFTTITFTTVGFGDVVLSPEWRLLSASTAINGMIMFGWSTAFIFEIMATLYKPMDKK